MHLSSPIIFEPLFMERVWGGRRLESLYGKRLPQGTRIGESWEIVDRPEAQSVVHSGPLRGHTLHELWRDHREALFGTGLPEVERFPLLCKMIDAQERLSIQVHPPAEIAAQYYGEPKDEMWYILDSLLESELYAGLRQGVTPESFRQALRDGHVTEQVHRIPVRKGDTLFMPSGRIHAIGAGNIVVEVQQNSDTTYRVFDWNRFGVNGLPRELHVAESLASMNFEDVEPEIVRSAGDGVVAQCAHFKVERWELTEPREANPGDRFAIFTVIDGSIECAGSTFPTGSFFFVPPLIAQGLLTPTQGPAAVLKTTIP